MWDLLDCLCRYNPCHVWGLLISLEKGILYEKKKIKVRTRARTCFPSLQVAITHDGGTKKADLTCTTKTCGALM